MSKLETQIFNLLQQSSGHMTAEGMYLHCRELGVSASMASVYRVLSKLADQGDIRRISIPGRPDMFDKTLSQHEHLVCRVCGAVQDFSIDNLEELIRAATGVMPDSFELSAQYVCAACKDKAQAC